MGGIEHNKVGQKCSVGKETDAWELEGVRELERGGSKWDIEAQHVLHSFTQSLVLQGVEISMFILKPQQFSGQWLPVKKTLKAQPLHWHVVEGR